MILICKFFLTVAKNMKKQRKGPIVATFICGLVAMITPAGWCEGSCLLKTTSEPYPALAQEWQTMVQKDGSLGVAATENPLLDGVLGFVVTDHSPGAKIRVLNSKATPVDSKQGSGCRFAEIFPAEKLEIQHDFTTWESALAWAMEVKNTGPSERWLELTVDAPVRKNLVQAYWDGWTEHQAADSPPAKDGLEAFPLSVASGENSGLALGLAPDTLISYMRSEFRDGKMLFTVRAVIPPGEVFKVKYLVYFFVPNFGYLDAVEIYQAIHPEWFRHSKERDPRLFHGTDTLDYARKVDVFIRKNPDSSALPGNTRPFVKMLFGGYGSHEWGYAPFRRAGDWLARKELWEWDMPEEERGRIAERSERTTHYNVMDYDKFIEDRRSSYHVANERLATQLSFYIINWIEASLLKSLGGEKYVYNYGQQGDTLRWVTSTSDEKHVFPWATVFEKTLRNDLPEVIPDLGVKAVALDIAGNPSKYRGPLDRHIQGWAFDEEGKFIATDVGTAQMLDYIRNLPADPYKMAVIGNGDSSFPVLFRLDATLNEGKAQPQLHYKDYEKVRLLRGDKTSDLHSGGAYANPALDVDWRKLSKDDIGLYYQDFINQSLLGCWQGGFLPSVGYSGMETFARALPVMLDVMNRGYRAAPASKGDPSLERARYGDALQSVIVISNPQKEAVSSDEEILGAYFGGMPLPASYETGALSFAGKGGQNIAVELKIPRNHTRLLTVPLVIKPDGNMRVPSIIGESTTDRRFNKISWRYKIHAEGSIKGRIMAESPPGFKISTLKIDGKTASVGDDVSWDAGEHVIEFACLSNIFRAGEELAAFPYEKALLVVEGGSDSLMRNSAVMLQDFFDAFEQKRPALADKANEDQTSVVIGKGEQEGISISDDGKIVRIEGRNPREIQGLTLALIRMLIENRGYVVPFYGNLPQSPTRDMLAAIGVDGGKYFSKVETAGKSVPEKIQRKITERPAKEGNEKLALPEITVPVLEGEVASNGLLSEPMWKDAARIDKMMPLKAGQALYDDEETTVRLFFTDERLWIGITSLEPEMGSLESSKKPRDSQGVWLGDHVEVYLAPGVAPREKSAFPFYQLAVDPSGNIWDAFNRGEDWNGNWDVSVSKDNKSWTAKIGIPLESLKNGSASDEWRFNIARLRSKRQIWSTWAPALQILQEPRQFGVLRRSNASKESGSGDEASLDDALKKVLKSSIETDVKINGRMKSAVLYADDRYYYWILSPRVPLSADDFDIINIYINSDPGAPTGRMGVIDGADWRILANLKLGHMKVDRYGNMPVEMSRFDYGKHIRGFPIPSYGWNVIMEDGKIVLMIEKEHLKTMPINSANQYYVVIYSGDNVVDSGVFASDQPWAVSKT